MIFEGEYQEAWPKTILNLHYDHGRTFCRTIWCDQVQSHAVGLTTQETHFLKDGEAGMLKESQELSRRRARCGKTGKSPVQLGPSAGHEES